MDDIGYLSLDEEDTFNCPRIITTLRTIDACFRSKDPNYNPY